MNFGRRLFDGAISAVQGSAGSPQQQQLPPLSMSSSASSPPHSTPTGLSRSGSSWPPVSPNADSPNGPYTPSPPDTPPFISGAAFINKERADTFTKRVSDPSDDASGSSGRLTSLRSNSVSNSPTSRKPVPQSTARLITKQTGLTRVQSPPVSRTPSLPSSQVNPRWLQGTAFLNTKDELIMEILSSEAVVDSREFEVLSSEQVEELKKELQVLTSRLGAANKKLSLESKIRDAAISLNKLHASHKRMSKTTADSLDQANRKVEMARSEVIRLSSQYNEVQRRLLEHRSAILSYTVGKLETQLRPPPVAVNGDVSGRSTPANLKSGEHSPTSGITSFSTSSRAKFEGAHFFAGHEHAVLPGLPKLAQVSELEEKLKTAEDALEATRRSEIMLKTDISNLRLQKSEMETSLGSNLQSAEETIRRLQAEVDKVGNMGGQMNELLAEKDELERTRRTLELGLQDRDRRLHDAETRLAEVERQKDQSQGLEEALSDVRRNARQDVERKEAELQGIREQLEKERKAWEDERHALEDEKMADMARLQQELEDGQVQDSTALQEAEEELDEARKALQSLVRSHRIVNGLSGQEKHVPTVVVAIGAHLDQLVEDASKQTKLQGDWEILRRKLEDDLRSSLDRRDKLGQEVEAARNEREEARKEMRSLEERFRDLQASSGSMPFEVSVVPPRKDSTGSAVSDGPVDERVMATLRSLWAILPSPEARAAKTPTRAMPGPPPSPLLTPTGRSTEFANSLSDLDVRALKALYDPRTGAASPLFSTFNSPAEFTVDGFAQRVRSLLADDRAIIERLLRFAQAHDLLKSNAERAQKLAQESSGGLETYQKQVKSLETRIATLVHEQTTLLQDLDALQHTVEDGKKERREIELKLADQSETCKNLQDANNTLSARALALAEEVSTAPETMRIKMEGQLAEVRRQLQGAQEEIEAIRTAEQSQKVALFEELNNMQSENAKLRDQLRKK